MTTKTLVVWEDLGFGVRHWPFACSDGKASDHVIEFEVIEIFGVDEDRVQWTDDSDVTKQPVDDHTKATLFASGSLKWDGCMNMKFDEQDRVMLHFCGKDDAARVGALLARVYDVLGPLIPAWDGA